MTLFWKMNHSREPGDVKDDPFDLSLVYEEFKMRAIVGAKLAARDVDGNGFVEPDSETKMCTPTK
jgi:hypothetical protein